jgi:hypothetical protein
MQPSRRAFLTGRRPTRSAWSLFCERIARARLGDFHDEGEGGGSGRARLTPSVESHAAVALALCREAGVAMVLEGMAMPPGPVLLLDPSALAGLAPAGAGGWAVGAGCRVGDLAALGLAQFGQADPALFFSIWLAETGAAWAQGGCADSGIESVSALLADGSAETFGPFGAAATRPLMSATAQRLVPDLFQLAASAEAGACRALARWPARYRLDALLPAPGREVNLAHLFCGHGGALAWIQGAVVRAPLAAGVPPVSEIAAGALALDVGLAAGSPPFFELKSGHLDRQVKRLFDPFERFSPFAPVGSTE